MEPSVRATASSPTSVPSWIMVGFILGALSILALPRRTAEPAAPPPRASEPPAPPKQTAPRLATIEAVFERFGQYAVWDHDLTEVALWNSQTGSFSDCYEVLRVGDSLYYRSIPHLTRPLLTHGLPDDPSIPLQFTEPQAQRDQWLRQSGQQGWNVLRQTLGGNAPPPAGPAPR